MELLKVRLSDLYPAAVLKAARERLMICRGCEVMRITSGIGMTCGEFANEIPGIQCGCVLKIKAYLPMFGCPQNKWKR